MSSYSNLPIFLKERGSLICLCLLGLACTAAVVVMHREHDAICVLGRSLSTPLRVGACMSPPRTCAKGSQ